MKKLYFTILALVLLLFTAFGFYSLVDKDQEISLAENRGLKQKPTFTLSSFFSGDYMEELDTYYTDQFPLREKLMGLNKTLNKFYYYSGTGDDNVLLIDTTGNAGAGGIGGVQSSETETAETNTETNTDAETGADTTTPAETQQETTEADPELDNPEDAETVNSLLVVGDRAMELVYGDESLEANYAQAVNNLANALGSGVKTYSLVTPNSAQFYCPEKMRQGSTDQEAQIDYVYSKLQSSVTPVDAYSKLRSHVDEYIYFRTDHHWTALGAYYAYTAFCEAAGLDAVELQQFETGNVTCSNDGAQTFLGTLYRNVRDYPQGDVLAANPDTATYYLPIVDTDATSYTSLENGVLQGEYAGIPTVATKVADTYLYMAFIGGDQPIEIITTDVKNDKVCMVLKESYGNAFVPFLTSHYSKIVVVDPRKFNTSDTPSLLLSDLAEMEGVTDLIVINYPFMPQSEYFTNRLNRLAGQ